MSNEELAMAIQNGETERTGELWDQIVKLVQWKAKRIMTALELRSKPCGVDFEDLVQCGYPAMVAAVESYKPENGSFSTWMMYHLQNAFAEATGYRTRRGQNDPINSAFSLDKPVTDEADSGLFGDIIPDRRATAAMDAVEEREFQAQLHEAMENALGEIPEKCSEILRLRYYQGMTSDEAGKHLGISKDQARNREDMGIRKLRAPKVAATLRPFCDFDFYSSTGLSSYQRTGKTIQERYLIREEDQRERQRCSKY